MAHARNFKDLTGLKVHRLTFLEYADTTRDGNARWKVRCDCGVEFVTTGKSIRNGDTKSCGCYLAEKNRIAGLKRRKHK